MVHASISTAAGTWLHAASCGMKPATYSRIRRCSSGLGSKMLIASSHHVAVPAQRFGPRPAPATTVQPGSGHQVLRRYGQPRSTRPDPPLGCRSATSRRCDRAARRRAHIHAARSFDSQRTERPARTWRTHGYRRSCLGSTAEPSAPESVISSAPRWQLVEVTLVDRAVTFEAVHADASVAAERTKVWWRELQVLLVA